MKNPIDLIKRLNQLMTDPIFALKPNKFGETIIEFINLRFQAFRLHQRCQ